MAFSDSKVYVNGCSKSCSPLKELETLKAKYDSQTVELNDTHYNLQNHKRGLAVIEEQLSFYIQNEAVFTNDIVGLRRDLKNRDDVISMLIYDIEEVSKQKENIQLSVDRLEYTSKGIQKIIESQLVNKAKSGLGYNPVAPPRRGMFVPPGIDLAHTVLEEFKEPEIPGYSPKAQENTSENQADELPKSTNETNFVKFVPEIESETKPEIFIDVQNNT